MSEERIILSERLEDLRRAVEWGREEQRKLENGEGEKAADELMKKMTPLILNKHKASDEK